MSASQNEQILSYLKKHKSITAMQALQMFGCFRLAARIYDLRQKGYEIISQNVKILGGGEEKSIAKYTLKRADA